MKSATTYKGLVIEEQDNGCVYVKNSKNSRKRAPSVRTAKLRITLGLKDGHPFYS
jgi:hypothetical protein